MSALLLASLLAVAAPLPAAAQEVHAFDVSTPDPASAIRAFGDQAGLQILASADDLKDKKFNPVSGDISTEEALNDLLAGTGLDHRYVGDRAVALVSNSSAAAVAPSETASTTSSPSASGDQPASQADGKSKKEDGKKGFWDRFRVAQVDKGTSSGPSPVEEENDQSSKKKKADQLEEVVITGSRIPRAAQEGAQEVHVYTREQIEQSGQTTASDFLNTLPDVSVSINEQNPGFITPVGVTTVTLHGLPIGTTLVLINGRRVETSGVTQGAIGNFFDINTIPLAAIERIEIISEGSSAIYGSDAIAGVVNFILRSNFDGFEADAKYGGASGTDQWNGDLAWGKNWSRGGVSIIGSVLTRSELSGNERRLTASGDFTPFGGQDTRGDECNPGNIFSIDGKPLPGLGTATYAAVPSGFTGQPTKQEFAPTAGTLNKCSLGAFGSLIPPSHRQGVLASGNYKLTPSIELFTELMFSHVQQAAYSAPPGLFAQPGFAEFTASASNPFNPFGETVGVSDLFTTLPRTNETNNEGFVRALVGARGNFLERWHWEISAWDAQDRAHTTFVGNINFGAVQSALDSSDSAKALDPFIAGAPASRGLLASLFTSNELIGSFGRTTAINGFARGPILNLPSGPLELVVGAEYDRDVLDQNAAFAGVATTFRRSRNAVFSEARVPILSSPSRPQAGDRLAITLAARYDDYNDFGHKSTPQVGVEWRPDETLLIRGSYSRAFKAPALYQLHGATFSSPGTIIIDPLRGNQQEAVDAIFGSNPNLQPETGQSRTFGFVYSSVAIPDLQLSLTHWAIDESNSIQELNLQALINNASLFPGSVVRAPSCTSGPPCPITLVNATEVNFGELNVAGFDYRISYKIQTAFGDVLPSIAATETYHYTSALTPSTPAIDGVSRANDDAQWAPRWKATIALGWKLNLFSLNVDGRYVGRYLDYQDIPNSNQLGNFWLYDANFRYELGRALGSANRAMKGVYIEMGGVNILSRLPQYSNYQFGGVGYDPLQADIRGRFLYVQSGVRW